MQYTDLTKEETNAWEESFTSELKSYPSTEAGWETALEDKFKEGGS